MLDDFLEDLGYSNDQIKIVHNIYPNKIYSESSLLFNFKNLYYYLNKNNISNEDFINITMTIPSIISLSLEDINNKIIELNDLGFNKINSFKLISKYPYIIEINKSTLKNSINSFKSIGFKENDIITVIVNNPSLLQGDFSNYKCVIDYLINYGYSNDNIMRLIRKIPELLNLNIIDIKNKYKKIEDFGFDQNVVIQITNIIPSILLSDKNLITDYFDSLLSFGYTNMDIIEIIKKIPIIFKDRYREHLNDKINNFSNLGINSKDIILMTSNNPYLFLYSEDNIITIYKNLLKLKYSNDDINKICVSFPLIFGYNWNYTLDKIMYYKKIDLDKYLISNSKILLLPIELVHSRYLYISKYKNIDNNYKDLFIDDCSFYKLYKIKRDSLLKGEF